MQKIAYLFICLFSGSATAGLLNGDTIFADGGSFHSGSATVDSGIEFTGSIFGTDTWEADFQDDLFTLSVSTSTNIGAGSGHTWKYTDLDFSDGGYISDVQLIDFLGTSFDNPAGIGFTEHSVSFTMGSFSLNDNDGLSTWGKFRIVTSPYSVPEPGSFALLGLGLVGLGLSRRKLKA